MAERLKSFSLSTEEDKEVELSENDTKIGYKKRGRSLISKVIGERKANFSGVRNAMTKLWGQRGLRKVVLIVRNIFQFVFEKKEDNEKILQGRP